MTPEETSWVEDGHTQKTCTAGSERLCAHLPRLPSFEGKGLQPVSLLPIKTIQHIISWNAKEISNDNATTEQLRKSNFCIFRYAAALFFHLQNAQNISSVPHQSILGLILIFLEYFFRVKEL